mmetsp:Transcript_51668/g.105177  ORF Transcript_51668/g.105177 Transcript_51668/m.105177 type:complete len:254 (-) Transcript_51668:416-1177(-)
MYNGGVNPSTMEACIHLQWRRGSMYNGGVDPSTMAAWMHVEWRGGLGAREDDVVRLERHCLRHLASILVRLVVPCHVLCEVTRRSPAQLHLGLVRGDEEGVVAERKRPLRQLEVLGVVGLNGELLAGSLRYHLTDLLVRVELVGTAVVDLACCNLLSADNRGKHGRHIFRPRDRSQLLSVAWEGAWPVTDDAIEEPVEVVPLVRRRPVDVLGAEGGPWKPLACEVLLYSPLAGGLGWPVLCHGLCVLRLVHPP